MDSASFCLQSIIRLLINDLNSMNTYSRVIEKKAEAIGAPSLIGQIL
jgi:hypothetical protein